MVYHSISNISFLVAYKIIVCLTVKSVLESIKYSSVEMEGHCGGVHGVNMVRDGASSNGEEISVPVRCGLMC